MMQMKMLIIGFNNNKKITNKSFEYKTKLIGNTPDDNNILDGEFVVPLKKLSNFWGSLDLHWLILK